MIHSAQNEDMIQKFYLKNKSKNGEI